MKTIIAGSRTITDPKILEQAIQESGFEITTVISGCARGVDAMGERWAEEHGIPVIRLPAEWKKHGKAAGPMRNQKMSYQAEAAIVVWDGASRGAGNLIFHAIQRGLKLYVKKVD